MIGYGLAGLSLIGTGFNVYSQLKSAYANRALAEYDARQIEAQARDTIDQGVAAAADAQARGRLVSGAQRAAWAGQGVSLNSGTAQAIAADTDRQLATEQNSIMADAVRASLGLRARARSTRLAGKIGAQGGVLSAAGTGLSGLGQAGSMAYQEYRGG
jgi:hypothetical protein